MIYDIHTHIIGLESGRAGNYLCPSRQMNFVLRLVMGKVLKRLPPAPGAGDDERLQRLVVQWVNESAVDRVVLLALDGVYRPDGTPDLDQTQFIVSNDYVADLAAGHPRLLFGASIHPWRKDALAELDRAAARGACLVKWLPSAQNIAPDDPRCDAFYERLAHHQIPLLSHTGVEHTLAKFSDTLNDPARLERALRRGVTVIAAHCGTRVFLYERSRFAQWAKLAREYPNCYGDLSAFGLPLHGRELRAILKDPVLLSKVLYGSDCPINPQPLWYLPWLGWRKAQELRAITNPLDKVYQTIRALGVPDEVFSRAGRVLRLPAQGGVR